MENRKIVIIDTNEKESSELKNKLEKHGGYEVVEIFNNANVAYEYVASNSIDLVICDILLHNSDGFDFLEKTKQNNANCKILVLTAVTGDVFVQKAMALGADYYMVKPYSFEILINRINELFDNKGTKTIEEVSSPALKNIDSRLSNIFITVGIPAHIKGYQFLREAIKMAMESPDIINSITRKLYPSIAEKFDTSSSKVERAIRHAIEVAWNRGKIEDINNLFGIKVYSDNEKPTNGEFIALVADKMLIEGA